MEQETFFRGTSRRVVLGSPTKQASNGRICLPITMPLTGQAVVGMPDWLGTAYEQVSQHFKCLEPEIEQIADIVVCFDNAQPNDQLFEDPSAKIPSADLKRFEVLRAGDGEDPEVQLQFRMYAPFQREFRAWVGEMAGATVYMGFPKSLGAKVPAPEQGKLKEMPAPAAEDQAPTESETEALAGDSNPPKDQGQAQEAKPRRSSKSGPTELKSYHDRVTAARTRRVQ